MNDNREQVTLCCQLGAREYYSIPRALIFHHINIRLITDIWIYNKFPFSFFSGKLLSRKSNEIPDKVVKSFNNHFFLKKVFRKDNTSAEIEFQNLTAEWILKGLNNSRIQSIISYSYAAKRIFEVGKIIGCNNVLAQINPGPEEAKIVEQLFREEYNGKYLPKLPNREYWNRWREECELSKYIVVNSIWSKGLLIKDGIPEKKIKVIPLAYERKELKDYIKDYPREFSSKRPLRLLYLGMISIRKGFHILRKVMDNLSNYPVVLDLVGSMHEPGELINNLPANIRFHGRKSGKEKDFFYKNADVFVLPTFSDGFALTQLEAQYWHLPVIVSKFCGNIITDRLNGIVINDINVSSITDIIISILDHPRLLNDFSINSVNMSNFSMNKIGKKWSDVIYAEN